MWTIKSFESECYFLKESFFYKDFYDKKSFCLFLLIFLIKRKFTTNTFVVQGC